MPHRGRCEIATQLPTRTGIRFRVFRVAASGERERERQRAGEERKSSAGKTVAANGQLIDKCAWMWMWM